MVTFTSTSRFGAIALAFLVGWMAVGHAFAADTGASPTPHAAPMSPTPQRLSATGTLGMRHEMKANKQIDIYNIRISGAKDPAGKALPAWSGKSLDLTGSNLAQAKKLQGRQVEVTGVSRDGKSLEVAAIHEMPATPKPASNPPVHTAPTK